MPEPESSPAAAPTKHKILLVDDHPVVLEALTKRLNKEDDLAVCWRAETSVATLQVLNECQPEVLVLDLTLDDGTDGVQLIKDIRAQHKSLPIVVFTMREEEVHAPEVLRAGAQGYVMKREPTENLVKAIRTVLKGGLAVSPQVSTRFLQSVLQQSDTPAATPIDTLGKREREVFELMGHGLGTSDIADRLAVSVKTIETYRARIKQKLHLGSGNDLVREAVRWIAENQNSRVSSES